MQTRDHFTGDASTIVSGESEEAFAIGLGRWLYGGAGAPKGFCDLLKGGAGEEVAAEGSEMHMIVEEFTTGDAIATLGGK